MKTSTVDERALTTLEAMDEWDTAGHGWSAEEVREEWLDRRQPSISAVAQALQRLHFEGKVSKVWDPRDPLPHYTLLPGTSTHICQ